jgi:hypothetical protein
MSALRNELVGPDCQMGLLRREPGWQTQKIAEQDDAIGQRHDDASGADFNGKAVRLGRCLRIVTQMGIKSYKARCW